MTRSTCSRAAMREGGIAYTFRGSEFGMCAHRHIASLRGMVEAAVDAKTRKMFDAGNAGEAIAKKLLQDLAAKDPRLVVEEYATGWQNQTSVKVEERRRHADGIDREVRLICSPDGRLASSAPGVELADVFAKAGWLKGSMISMPPAMGKSETSARDGRPLLPRRWSLEVKCYGKTSLDKFEKKGAASNQTLEWQTSGVSAGYEDFFKEPVGVVVLALYREELKDEDGNFVGFKVDPEQVPAVWVYDRPRYTKDECLARCWDVVNAYEAHEWVKCDNTYFCRYPHKPTPVIDVVAEAMLESLDKTWKAFQNALRDAEGLFVGAKNGDLVGGYHYCRQLLSVPMVKHA